MSACEYVCARGNTDNNLASTGQITFSEGDMLKCLTALTSHAISITELTITTTINKYIPRPHHMTTYCSWGTTRWRDPPGIQTWDLPHTMLLPLDPRQRSGSKSTYSQRPPSKQDVSTVALVRCRGV